MERFEQAAHKSVVPDSRRARREVEHQAYRKAKPARTTAQRSAQRAKAGSNSPTSRRIGRAGILISLALATIVVPIGAGAGNTDSPEAGIVVAEAADTVQSNMPSTYSVLTSSRAADDFSVIVSEEDLLAERSAQTASRSTDRAELPGCVPGPITSGNGLLGESELCALWNPDYRLQADAANSFNAFNDAYRARFGEDICLVGSYRPLAAQVSVAARKPGLAATPGKSMHGWGVAVDFCDTAYSSPEQWNWLNANGPVFGWGNPAWARRGGSGAYEPWHWEYFPIAAGKY